MSTENTPDSSDNATNRIAALEKSTALIMDYLKKQTSFLEQTTQRLDRLEQATNLIAEAAVKSAENERVGLVVNGLANASKIFTKNRTVVFWGRNSFSDNVKYAYLDFYKYAQKHAIECNYMTYDEAQYQQLKAAGLPCLPRNTDDWTEKETNLLLSAKVLVICNVFFPVEGRDYIQYALTRGAKVIQLWHGVPLKRIGLEDLRAPSAYQPRNAEVLGASGPFDIFVGGSLATREEWAKRFAFKEYAAIGYPRMDVLFREPSEGDLINVDVETLNIAKSSSENGKPFILYAPTFRDRKPGAWLETVNIDLLAKHCVSKGYTFYVNLHPFEQEINERLQKMYPEIKCVARGTDIYPILKHVDILITDYSSLAIDFLPRNKPIVFYTPDHDEYTSVSRSLIDGYEEYMTGERTNDISSLIDATDAAVGYLKNPKLDIHANKRNALKHRVFDHTDGLASKRLCELIAQKLDEP